MNKVWIINQYTITPEYPASTRHYELAKYLAKYNEVTLWGSNFIHHNKTYRSKRRWTSYEETLEGFRLIWVTAVSYKNNGVSRMINMLLYALTLFFVGVFRKGSPDVIIGSSPSIFAAYASMLISKVRRVKFILEVRDLWPDSLTEITGKDGGLFVRLMRWMERSLYRNSDYVVGLTEGITKQVEQRGVSADKLLFLPNGIDMEVTSVHSAKGEGDLRERINLALTDKVFMYAGAHGPANDLTQLMEAAEAVSSHSKIKFVLMGEGVEKEKLKQMVINRRLDNVLFLPAIPKSEVQKYLSFADAYLICLKDVPLYEGALPNKLFDYLLQDKPIVTTVPGELRQFLESRNLGVYGNMKEQGDQYLPLVLKRIADGDYKNPIEAGSELVRSMYSRQGQADTLNKIIQKLIES